MARGKRVHARSREFAAQVVRETGLSGSGYQKLLAKCFESGWNACLVALASGETETVVNEALGRRALSTAGTARKAGEHFASAASKVRR